MKNSNRVRLIGATVATSLVASLLPAVAVAQDAPQEKTLCEAYEGQFDWGIRESFRTYILEGAAKGTMELQGELGTNGVSDRTAEDFAFRFKPTGVKAVDGDTGVINLQGGLHFTGHGGVLDTTFSNFRLDIDGTAVKIVTDYTANKASSLDHNAEVTKVAETNKVMAEYTLKAPVDFMADAVDLGGSVPALTADGRVMFNEAYKVGAKMDPVAGQLTCAKKAKPTDEVKPTESVPTTAPTVEKPTLPTESVPTTAP
ncbi:MAG: HtaA domain-containing protein, partial [Corynebacterium sp.]|nr:HtaA domain-containing protein [Corynebacterium sp.]